MAFLWPRVGSTVASVLVMSVIAWWYPHRVEGGLLLAEVLIRGILASERVLVMVAVRCQRFGPTRLCSRTRPTVVGAHGSQPLPILEDAEASKGLLPDRMEKLVGLIKGKLRTKYMRARNKL